MEQQRSPYQGYSLASGQQDALLEKIHSSEEGHQAEGDDEMAAQHALTLCQEGRYEEAEEIYRRIISMGKAKASTYCNLGNLCRLSGRKDDGNKMLWQCVEIDRFYTNGWFNLGVAYQQDGNPREAIRLYRKALALKRDHQVAIRNQGIAFHSLGRATGAFICFKRSFTLNPKEPEWLLDAASLDRRLYGAVINELQHRLEAEPTDARTALCLGAAMREAGMLEEAAIQNAVSLAASPKFSQLWIEQAMTLMTLGEMEQGIFACDEALKLDPDQAVAHFVKGNCLRSLRKLVEAEHAMQCAVNCNPEFESAIVNLAIHKRDQGLLNEAISLLEEAIRLKPEHPEAWEGLLFSYSIGGTKYQEKMLRAANAFTSMNRKASSGSINEVFPPRELLQGKKHRIGILSAEIGDHVVSTFLNSYLSNYSREEFVVELIIPFKRKEPRARELAQKADHLICLKGKETEAARALLRSRNYNILIETSGHTEHNSLRILSERCAPIQCHYIGFHSTTGLDTIDYIIADEEVLPKQIEPFFVEKPWRIDRPWLACSQCEPTPLAAATVHSPSPVWGSFGQVAKIREETLHFWGVALQAVPEATLLIKDRNTVFSGVQSRILNLLKRYGVHQSRISFLPWSDTWQEHMLSHNLIDIALDTTPWSSSTTAFNALSMGVPLVAIRGQTMASRMSASIVRGIGKDEWICDTEEEFASILVRLSNMVDILRSNKQTLQAEVLESQLFDGKDLARHIESAFTKMITQCER